VQAKRQPTKYHDQSGAEPDGSTDRGAPINNQPTWIRVATIAQPVATITGTMSEAACPAAGNEPSTATAQLCAACGEALAMRNAVKKTTPAEGQATASSSVPVRNNVLRRPVGVGPKPAPSCLMKSN